jgi:hypothetical protein
MLVTNVIEHYFLIVSYVIARNVEKGTNRLTREELFPQVVARLFTNPWILDSSPRSCAGC